MVSSREERANTNKRSIRKRLLHKKKYEGRGEGKAQSGEVGCSQRRKEKKTLALVERRKPPRKGKKRKLIRGLSRKRATEERECKDRHKEKKVTYLKKGSDHLTVRFQKRRKSEMEKILTEVFVTFRRIQKPPPTKTPPQKTHPQKKTPTKPPPKPPPQNHPKPQKKNRFLQLER